MPALKLSFGLMVDPLSALMLLIITGVGWLIHWYSTAYMADDKGYARYFTYLNLFVFFMLLLVMGANMLVTFVGWEGVGLASYLLIGFYYERTSATNAGKKAFIVNRIGGLRLSRCFVFDFPLLRHVRLLRRRGHFDAGWYRSGDRERLHGGMAQSLSPRSCRYSCCLARRANRRKFRCTCGCPTRWKARHRCPPSSTPRRW